MRTLTLRAVAAPLIAVLALAALVIGSAAIRVGAADHLDAPSLGSLSVGALKGDRDINDVYVFPAVGNRTVLAMTTNPAVNVPAIDPFGAYGTNVQYRLNIDNTGDFVQDVSYVTTFGQADGAGTQHYTVKRYTGSAAVTASGEGKAVASGFTNNAKGKSQSRDGVMAFAGQRSDPFFFDLIAFRDTLGFSSGSQRFCDGSPSDFFAPLDTLAIVLEVPDGALGTNIGVWADTRQATGSGWAIVDQMGRPAINTVFNGLPAVPASGTSADKEAFNVTPPSMQDDAGKPFRGHVSAVLQALGGYSPAAADSLAAALVPDVITYNTSSSGTNILNGRALADDVIDAELQIVLANPAASDCVGAHADVLAMQGTFPYLAHPH
jgi:hypothetical protein